MKLKLILSLTTIFFIGYRGAIAQSIPVNVDILRGIKSEIDTCDAQAQKQEASLNEQSKIIIRQEKRIKENEAYLYQQASAIEDLSADTTFMSQQIQKKTKTIKKITWGGILSVLTTVLVCVLQHKN